MKIRSLYIDRFGKFTNKKITLPDAPFVLIQGPNEAGKSTLMSYITTMLFGFPLRQKRQPYSKLNQHANLGGKLIVEMENKEMVTIERHDADKEASAYSKQSDLKNQELMKFITKGLDRTLYQAIFCFDLSGLDGLENIKDEELNHYLFSTGMMGSARIQKLEKYLEKYQSELFKPSGKNPVLNKLLAQLEYDTSQKQNWIKKNDTYLRLREQRQLSETSLLEIQRNKEELLTKVDQLQKYLALKPLILDYLINQKRSSSLSIASNFPEDGVIRLENLQQQLIDYKSDLEEVQATSERLDNEIVKLEVNNLLLDKIPEIDSYLNSVHYIDRLKEERVSHKEAVHYIDDQINEHLTDLGEGWSETRIETVDTGLVAKESLKDILSSFTQLMQDTRAMALSLTASNEKLLNYRKKLDAEEKNLLSQQDRQQLQAQVIASKEQQVLISKEESLKELQRQKDKQVKSVRQFGNKIVISGIIFGMLIIIGLFMLNQLPIAIGIGVGVILTSIFIRQFLLRIAMRDAEQITRELTLIHHKLMDFPDSRTEDIQQRLHADDMTKMVVDVTIKQLEEEEMIYKDLNLKQNHYETQELILERQFEEWCQQIGFSQSVSRQIILDLFNLIEQSKQKIRDKQRLFGKINHIDKELSEYYERFIAILEDVQIETPVTDEELKQMVLLEKQKNNQRQQFQRKLSEKQEQATSLQRRIHHVTSTIEELYQQAGVECENQFRERAKMNLELIKVQSTLESLSNQIDLLAQSKKERHFFWELVEDRQWDHLRLNEYNQKISDMIDGEQKIRQSISDIKSEMKYHEENNQQSKLIHTMENDRSSFSHYAKKWAVYRTASELLRLTKEQYRQDRLPRLLKMASHYFNKITGEKYIDIIMVENEGFSAVSHDGDIFGVIELSRGTKEQLYLSIRLALATLFDSATSYPIIIDDSFVNFDHGRLGAVIDLLKEISSQRQIILFTCHTNQYNHYRNIPVVSLNHNVEEALYD